MKWPAKYPDLNLTKDLWKIFDDKVMAEKSTTLSEPWKRLKKSEARSYQSNVRN